MDEGKMRRALYNIASNARDVLPPGGSLYISTCRTKQWLEFRFEDNGPGIPPEIRETLFEPFVTFGKTSGTGLGLAIAHKAVQDHGGTITASSVPGKGAIFVIQLPCEKDPPLAANE
jgi:signal transduction histidine kinase